ncbi:fibronectin type III domain-containing protein [Stigmatella aurantiaca]|uniref:chitinase n=1 Tax=Stigmatella aurantiaca (strain DW4/3-1) TaxID=378806 RepID=Q092X1_STIAD|nr:glycosyl hydrolase family 18 protein [Stigmatella aurantiaca]ADO73661.1 Chitinase, class II [Stigmatella aurantiaca DW4/3-1]EAU66810.1 chitinase D [Stigmatella aurantiaca DW4/3-1]
MSQYGVARTQGQKLFAGVAVLALLVNLLPSLAFAADRGAWAAYVNYVVGDSVTYGGKGYDCRQSHQSLPGWEPPNVPALWLEKTGSVDVQAPTAPTGLTSSGKTANSVSLTWNASTDNVGVTGYEVFIGGSATAAATTTGATSVTVSGLNANTTYTFTVKARDAAGNRSAASSAFSVTTNPPSTDTQAPTVPASLRSTGTASSSVSLAWNASTDNVGVTGYEVFIGGSATAAATTTGATSVTVSGLAANTSYSFTVKARDAAGNRSAASAALSVKTQPAPSGDVPSKILVGYWHNFDNGSGFIRLRNVSPKWDVINISFAEPTNGATGGTIGFTPYSYTDADFKADVAYLQSQGKKVIISIGGANGQVRLENATSRTAFVNSMGAIIEKYGFDGMDIDFEGHSLSLDAGDADFKNPRTPVVTNLIAAIRALRERFGAKFLLTMAPETFFVQLGYSFYGGSCISCDNRAGAYLPVIYAVRDILSWLQVQDYNSGPITGLDDQYHSMGNADFHVAMTDMLLAGFPVAKNPNSIFPALRPDQVAIGLPANVNAGGGYTAPAEVQKAVNALVKGTSIGSYTLRSNPANNKGFRGLMSWSVNWDAFANFEFTNSHRPYLDSLK